jgi:hypothetical protein
LDEYTGPELTPARDESEQRPGRDAGRGRRCCFEKRGFPLTPDLTPVPDDVQAWLVSATASDTRSERLNARATTLGASSKAVAPDVLPGARARLPAGAAERPFDGPMMGHSHRAGPARTLTRCSGQLRCRAHVSASTPGPAEAAHAATDSRRSPFTSARSQKAPRGARNHPRSGSFGSWGGLAPGHARAGCASAEPSMRSRSGGRGPRG